MNNLTQPTCPASPKELADREIVNTPIGPVCMSRTEYETYREELALRKLRDRETDCNGGVPKESRKPAGRV